MTSAGHNKITADGYTRTVSTLIKVLGEARAEELMRNYGGNHITVRKVLPSAEAEALTQALGRKSINCPHPLQPQHRKRNREIIRLFTEEGMTQTEIARRFKLTNGLISKIVKGHVRGPKQKHTASPLQQERSLEAVRLYYREDLTMKETARSLGLSVMTVSRLIRKHNQNMHRAES